MYFSKGKRTIAKKKSVYIHKTSVKEMLDSKINAIKNIQIHTRLEAPPLPAAFDKNVLL